MKKRIFLGIFSTSILILLLVLVFAMGVLYEYFAVEYEKQMESEALYIAEGLKSLDNSRSEETAYLDRMSMTSGKNRITLIDSNGEVLYDSVSDASQMENHLEREEVQAAIKDGRGQSRRYSVTLAEQTVYYAVLLDDGSILRISTSRSTVLALVIGMIQPILLIVVIALILSLVLSAKIAARIVKPINEINPEKPDDSEVYDELSPLISKLEKQNELIRTQIEILSRQQKEFGIITENMAEGFIVVDENANILSYNKSALKLLQFEDDAVSLNILEINRSEPLRIAVDKALEGEHNEQLLETEERVYSIIANPVITNRVTGVVIAIIDVTEKEARDRLRREFTANVSHELKTPLTSILGFAEIMKAGMVKPEDINHFSENIYNEAKRLLDLIGDILKISKMEENSLLPEPQNVDLLSAASLVAERLQPIADKNGLKLEIEGESVEISAIYQVLDEVMYNLIDNALKYNRPNGSVNVTVGRNEAGLPFLTVKDTGMGISEPDQERIFERFYRVDKAHSRAIGGTGLGLAIVKHGVSALNARIELSSVVDEGTTISVIFSGESLTNLTPSEDKI